MFDPDLYKRALDFAARAHGPQEVPGSRFPYVVHVTKVAMEVIRAGEGDVNLSMVCALLHDTMEDRDVKREALATEFGEAVAAGVEALSKNSAVLKEQQMADSLARVRLQPKEIWRVKLADRITNLEPAPPAWPSQKKVAYAAQARVILETLAGASPYLERRLAEKIAGYSTS